MDDLREKVINGLECCLNGPMQCEKCRYRADDGTTVPQCVKTLREDAIALLKAQQPRVMTLEEVKTWIKTDTLDRDPIYFETRGFSCGEWIDPFEDFDGADIVGYGSDVRCWTSRPTDEQREATPWE